MLTKVWNNKHRNTTFSISDIWNSVKEGDKDILGKKALDITKITNYYLCRTHTYAKKHNH